MDTELRPKCPQSAGFDLGLSTFDEVSLRSSKNMGLWCCDNANPWIFKNFCPLEIIRENMAIPENDERKEIRISNLNHSICHQILDRLGSSCIFEFFA